MKNTLLTTTAIALTGFAGTASAVEVAAGAVTLNIGGSFLTTAAISNVDAGADTDFDGLDILTSSEIHFKPSMTLDNGITIGADVELEGNTTSDQIDESTIFAKGGFGKVEVGSKDSAGKLMQKSNPDVSLVYANSTSLGNFVPFTGDGETHGASYPSTFQDFAGDADRITYFTPDFSGFQVGFSYARNNSQNNGTVDNNANDTDYVDIGATYGGTFGGVDLGLSARYGTYDKAGSPAVDAIDEVTAVGPTNDAGTVADGDFVAGEDAVAAVGARNAVAAGAGASPTVTGVGVTLGFGAVSFGGGYVEIDLDTPGVANSEFYDIGVSFANGPMSYSLALVNGENGENGSTVASESRVIVAAALYAVNSHFYVGLSISDVELDVIGSTDDDVDGQVFALSAYFSF